MSAQPPIPQPWSPAIATTRIRALAKENRTTLSLTVHAKTRMMERNLILADLLHVLRNGFVFQLPEPASMNGFFKYQIEGKSPNSGARFLRVVAIPDEKSPHIKIVTIMWRDEI